MSHYIAVSLIKNWPVCRPLLTACVCMPDATRCSQSDAMFDKLDGSIFDNVA
jgi:hypothetical protein